MSDILLIEMLYKVSINHCTNTNFFKLDTYILFSIFIDMFNFSDLKMNTIIKNYVIILREGGF